MSSEQPSYVIFTDSACDIDAATLAKWNVRFCSLSCTNNDIPQVGLDSEEGLNEFYKRMRDGEAFKTAAVTPGDFCEAFSEVLSKGKDILYIGFSSGLSATVESATQAARIQLEEYPERTIYVVDSLCASAGYGLLIYLTATKRDEGASLEEARDYAEVEKLEMRHLFTVDDLVYLKRGGRVSGASANIATVLNIKPVMHVDAEGKLSAIGKVHGRKKAIADLATRYGQWASHCATGPVFISHGDCIDDANALADLLKEKFGVGVDIITSIGPVIGAHSGPGTLALFFEGREK